MFFKLWADYPTFEVYIPFEYEITCSKGFQIGTSTQENTVKSCEEQCEKNEQCRFYSYDHKPDRQDGRSCSLYTGCHSQRSWWDAVQTYRKPIVPGLAVRFYLK